MGNRIKFLTNNFLEPAVLPGFSYSSQSASYPASNLQDPFRSKVWRSGGLFTIDWNNSTLEIFDGTQKTVNLTRGDYSAASLSTELETQLNTVSANWTVTYSSSTNKFSISNTSVVSILWTQATQAAETFGFNSSIDDTGATSYEGDERRISYPAEWIKFDFGLTRNPKGIVLIDNLEEDIKIQPSITLKFQGSPSDSWNSPEEVLLDYNPDNITKIDMGGVFSRAYRFARLYIEDINNPLGYQQLGKIYVGDVFELESSDVQRDFGEEPADLSTSQRAIGGEIYSDIRPSHVNFPNVIIQYCNKNDVDTIKNIWNVHRTYKPFFVSIDSEAEVTNNVNEWTKYVKLINPPKFKTVSKGIWTVTMAFEELL